MSTPGFRIVLASALLSGVLLAACGDDDEGEKGGGSSDEMSELFVASAERGTLEPAGGDNVFTLTLEQPDARVIVFTDRPERIAGTEPLVEFVDAWESRGFDQDPPNAALEVTRASGEPMSSVFELSDPIYDPSRDSVTFDASVLGTKPSTALEAFGSEENLPSSFGEPSLFIDDTQIKPTTAGASCEEAQRELSQAEADLSKVQTEISQVSSQISRVEANPNLSEAQKAKLIQQLQAFLSQLRSAGAGLESTITAVEALVAKSCPTPDR